MIPIPLGRAPTKDRRKPAPVRGPGEFRS